MNLTCTHRFTYVQNEINGEATLTRPDGSQEVLHFNQGSKHGQAEEHFKDGSREIHTYVDGVLEGEIITYIPTPSITLVVYE